MAYSKTVTSNINLITSNSTGRPEVSVPPDVPFVCTSTHLDDTFWNNNGDPFFNGVWNGTLQRWEIAEQTNTGAQRILTNDPVPAWAIGFRPSKLYITAYASANDEVGFDVSNCTASLVGGGLVELGTTSSLFEFDLSNYTGDINELGFAQVSADTIYIDCIQFA